MDTDEFRKRLNEIDCKVDKEFDVLLQKAAEEGGTDQSKYDFLVKLHEIGGTLQEMCFDLANNI